MTSDYCSVASLHDPFFKECSKIHVSNKGVLKEVRQLSHDDVIQKETCEPSVFLNFSFCSLSFFMSCPCLCLKPITLLLESVSAKDMSCLIAGYCRVFVDPNLNIFPWIDDSRKHKVSAEEGKEKSI